TYATFVALALGALYSPYAGDSLTAIAADFAAMLADPPRAARTARASLIRRIVEVRRAERSRDFPYDNGLETYSGVACTDGRHPKSAAWPGAANAADRRAPYFGRLWNWGTVQCARDTWTVRDEDAYTGPFDRSTAAPVLLVGSRWDPATNFTEAAAVARMLPRSRLLTSNNWGHTGYGTSNCVTEAVDNYLLTVALPPAGKVCIGDVQPFREPLSAERRVSAAPTAGRAPYLISRLTARPTPAPGRPKLLPPVTIRLPGSRS
ncbi:MAG TPA: alpha/beta hydrolase, partial [Actinoplanes sp.]|nr:alpha/beta hydrolase [Actinoplanes sp.]